MQRLRAPFIVSVCIVLLLAWHVVLRDYRGPEEGMLTVVFLDVGQGDAIFIESPSGTQVLIDGGKDGGVLRVLSRLLGFFDRDLDMILATHADTDHVGGLIDIIENYAVGTIVMTENVSDASAFRAFKEAATNESAEIIFTRRGHVYDLGNGPAGSTTLTILFPDYDPTSLETNTASIVAKLTYGETEYLLTGDAPSAIEEYLVGRDGVLLQSDVLKLGHHGSDTSSSAGFLATVRPRIGIISAGKDNSYGHPHQAVLDRLFAENIPYKNTAESGGIISVSDGKEIWFR
jgi:competence protein ComEC